jgi:hypothetical protein
MEISKPNRVLRRIFGPKIEEVRVTVGGRKMLNDEFHGFVLLPDV